MAENVRIAVLRSYRHLLRARLTAFRNDPVLLNASATKVRQEYEKNKQLTDVAAISKLAKNAEASAAFLIHNVAQATVSDKGVLAVNVDVKRHEINDYH